MSLFRRIILAGIFLCVTSALAKGLRSESEGLPLPWPFPWARHCPVDWASLQGRYNLIDSNAAEYLQLRLDSQGSKSHPVATVWRTRADGTVSYVGVTYLSPDQDEIRVFLTPARGGGQPYWAYIRMYYADEMGQQCAGQTVPIFTLKRAPVDHHPVQYRMEKQPCPKFIGRGGGY